MEVEEEGSLEPNTPGVVGLMQRFFSAVSRQ